MVFDFNSKEKQKNRLIQRVTEQIHDFIYNYLKKLSAPPFIEINFNVCEMVISFNESEINEIIETVINNLMCDDFLYPYFNEIKIEWATYQKPQLHSYNFSSSRVALVFQVNVSWIPW